ncbi:RICIN domain-containing protein [Clostridium butyricum]
MNIRKNKFFMYLMCLTFLFAQAVFFLMPAKKAEAAEQYVRIKNAWQQNYLYEDGDTVKYGNIDSNNEYSQWIIEATNDGQVNIKNKASGKYMNIENMKDNVECTNIDSSWQSAKWTVENLDNNQKRIRSVWKNNECINIENLKGYAEHGTVYDAWASAKWVFENVDGNKPEQPDKPEQPGKPEQPVNPSDPVNPVIPGNQGANMPYVRYEAENAKIGGNAYLCQAIDFDYNKTASEASNQRYIALPSNDSYVEWTMDKGGAGVNMRFTMPDSNDGMGLNGSLDIFVNDVKVKTVNLSSYWSWQYFNVDVPEDAPGNGKQAAFRFDETHFKLDTALKAGDKLKIKKTNGDNIEYGIDFVEVENIKAPIAKPANAYSVTDFGAVANDNGDDMAAFNACVEAAARDGKSVYIPEGQFDLGSMWTINANNITITGAGMWYTNIHFTSPNPASGGISLRITGTIDFGNVYLSSMLRSRHHEQAVYKCFMDNFGTNSRIHDFWEEHFECGFWVADYAHTPAVSADGLVISNGRIRNNLADGVNFCQGTKNSTVRNCSVRNNGDDGLAMWPHNYLDAQMEVNNTFEYNTIENNWRAAGIAIFGGSGHKATNNYIKDCFMGSGIRLNTVFPGYHFDDNSGIQFSDTTIVNCGTSKDCYNGERGAIDLEAANAAIRNVTFDNINIINAQRDAIEFGGNSGYSNINFNNITIDGTGKDSVTSSRFSEPHEGKAVYTYTGNGSANFNNLTLKNIEAQNPYLIQNGFGFNIR